ncbi:YoaK family protein [Luteibacter sp. W1I16]|uniref:YoaK family protein n=1 Tax=Luteibacter sp. W1I16 TaxID=3373922 RepID=UPI003D197AF9
MLPFAAGATNAIALLALRHGGVTHLTGISTEGAIGIGTADGRLLLHALAIMGLFTLGCAISAWAIRSERWARGPASVAVLCSEAALLALAAHTLDIDPTLGTCLCGLAIGLQNGASSLVTGAVLRTSHLTGMFTDLGIAMGQRWRGAAFDPRRTRICVVVIGAFIAGGACGAVLFGPCSGRALWLPALVVIAMAASTGLRLGPPPRRNPPAE